MGEHHDSAIVEGGAPERQQDAVARVLPRPLLAGMQRPEEVASGGDLVAQQVRGMGGDLEWGRGVRTASELGAAATC